MAATRLLYGCCVCILVSMSTNKHETAKMMITPEGEKDLVAPIEPLRYGDFDEFDVDALREAGSLIIDEMFMLACNTSGTHDGIKQASITSYWESLEQQLQAYVYELSFRLHVGMTPTVEDVAARFDKQFNTDKLLTDWQLDGQNE